MEQFLGFALPGVPYGCTYALVAVCLVLTYQATGVFNFAFGAQAFASAFIFTYLTQYHGWSGFEAFVLSVVIVASNWQPDWPTRPGSIERNSPSSPAKSSWAFPIRSPG